MISLIIPFYNEALELPTLIRDLSNFKKNNLIYEYIFIDDKSTDNSIKILNKLLNKFPKIKKKTRIILNQQNIGWCESLKKGYSLARGKYSLFIPGDGEAKITEFLTNLKLKETTDVFIFQRKSMIGRPMFRVIISYLYKNTLSIIFNNKKIDLNGIILVKTNLIKKINLLSNSFFISAEIILRCKKKNYKIDYNNYFFLFPKKKYKSNSLNFKQIKKVLFDFFYFLHFYYFK